MEETPITVVVPAIKTKLWMNLYDSLSINTVPFELIFIGNVYPDFDLPKNVRHIYTEVKPAQCFHIGVLASNSKYIIQGADDYIFSDHHLDILYEALERCNNIYSFAAGVFARKITVNIGDQEEIQIEKRKRMRIYFFGKNSHPHIRKRLYCPFLPNGAVHLFRKEAYMKIGGIDRRFVKGYYDMDLAMTLYSFGGNGICLSEAYVYENTTDCLSISDSTDYDGSFFYSLWCFEAKNPKKRFGFNKRIDYSKERQLNTDIRVLKTRSEPIDRYDNDNLMEFSQGEKGRWK
jgi:hypothetical protein